MYHLQLLSKAATLVFVFLLIVLATTAIFWHVIVSDLDTINGEYDVYRYFGPWTFYFDHVIQSGEFPLWNSLIYCGMPVAGNPQSFAFYPPNLLRALLTTNPNLDRSTVSLALMMGLHLVFLAFCTYLFGRAHGLTLAGALAAALSFSFSAIMIMRMCDYIFVLTMAWLPLILLLIKYALDEMLVYRKLIFSVLAGLALGMSILGGYVQIINLQGLLIGLYALFYFLLNTKWDSYQGGKNWTKIFLVNGIAMALVMLVACGLAAAMLLPVWEFGAYSVRTGDMSSGKLSNLWGYTPLMLYQSIVVYTGMDIIGESIRNSGIIALVLAFAGLTHPKRRDVFMFLVIYLLLFECSFGPPLPLGTLLEKITPFSLSAYTRAYDFALFPLSMLAGFGLDAVITPMSNKGYSYARGAVILLFAVVCLSPLPQWIPEIKNMEVTKAVIYIPASGVAVMFIIGLFRFYRPIRFVAAALLVALLFGEIFTWNLHFVPRLTRKKINDVIEIPRENLAIPTTNVRETDHITNRFLYALRFAMNGVDPMHVGAIRDMLSGPPRDRMKKRLVHDWEPTRENLRGNLFLKRSFWLAKQYSLETLPGKREYFPSATLVFLEDEIAAPITQIQLRNLPRSSISTDAITSEITTPAALFEPVEPSHKKNLSFLTKLPLNVPEKPVGPAGAVHSALVYTFKSETNAVITTHFKQPGTDRSEYGITHTVRPTGDRETQVEVPLPDFPDLQAEITVDNTGQGQFKFAKIEIKSDENDEDGLIRILKRTANTVDLNVGPLTGHRILTFLDLYYPGWEAYVNGEKVNILRANENFKALLLPPGTHDISFRFAPLIVRKSTGITFMTLLASIAVIIICIRKGRHHRPQKSPYTMNGSDQQAPAVPAVADPA